MVGDRSRGPLVAFLVVALCVTLAEAALAALLVAFDWLFADVNVWGPVIAVVCAIGAGCCIAGLVGLGRRGPTAIALAGVLGAQLVVCAFLVTRVADLWAGLGHEGFQGAHGFVLGAVLAAAAALAAVAAWFLHPPARVVAVALAAIVVLGGAASAVGSVAVEVTGADCDRFRFDAERWAAEEADDGTRRTTREKVADALVECGTLDGRTREEVRALLGPPSRPPGGERGDEWVIGYTSGVLFPGDDNVMVVAYDGGGRVSRVWIPSEQLD